MSDGHRTTEWNRARALAKPRLQAWIDAGNGSCFDCGNPIPPGTRTGWEVAHKVPLATMLAMGATLAQAHDLSNLTASHATCNRRSGGRAGAKISNQRRAATRGWVDEW